MNVLIEREKMLKSLAKVQSVVERRNIMPILEHVKIDITPNEISFVTTDMDITIKDSFLLDQEGNFSFTTPVQQLYDITRKLHNCHELNFDLSSINSGRVEIIAGASSFIMPCLSPEEFPSFEEVNGGIDFKMMGSDLKNILMKTKHAMSAGEMRYYLNGTYLHTENNHLVAVATDVHRLAITSIDIPTDLDLQDGIIIPRKTIGEIIKLADGIAIDDEILININANKIQLKFDNIVITSRLINGKYPTYKSIFAIKQDKRFSVEIKELKNAIELVSAISEGKIKVVKLLLDGNKLTISVDNSQDGKGSSGLQELSVDSYIVENENDEAIPCDDTNAFNINFLLNAKYLLDILSISIGPRMHFDITNGSAPIVVRDTAAIESVYVLMPMQLEG